MTQAQYPHKILIVEDEEIMLKTLVDNLTNAGFSNILKATNGVDGLDVALREKPDLILLDIVMPIMDGMTMLNKLRESLSDQSMKVIFLTNLTVDDSIMKGVMKNIPSYYLVKTDHSIDDVINKVKVTLDIEPLSAQ